MMRLTSTAFEPGTDIPAPFTCDGQDVSPPLSLQDIPAATVSLVLIMDDPDAPGGTWDHWIAYDIPLTTEIPQGVRDLGTAGRNSWGRTGYGGPCPPRGAHRYVLAVYALDTSLGLPAGADKPSVLEAIEGHVLAEARLMGRYQRSGR
jgi:Raf kinase inhibitor-like YbhB/YbcL family protein